MGKFQNIFRIVFPKWALRRTQDRLALAMIEKTAGRSFEAILGGRTRSNFLTSSESPDSAITGSIDTLRAHTRQLEFNNGHIAGPIRRIKNNVVGKGFKLQAKVKADKKFSRITPRITEKSAEEINFYAEKYFNQWEKESDVHLVHHFSEQVGLVESSLIRDGEVIVISRISKRKSRLIPYCLEVLEADRINTPMEEISNPHIRHGFEYDSEGVPKYCFVLKVHPGETLSLAKKRDDYEQVPMFFDNGMRKVFYLFDPVRPEQTRGFSPWAPGLKDLQDLDRYMEAEKFAALMAACSVAVHKRPNPKQWTSSLDSDSSGNKIFDFAPGAVHQIADDEEIDFNDPKRPNSAFGEFIKQLSRGPANALDIPPEVFSQDWAGMNYSNARTVLLQFYLTCSLRQIYLIRHLAEPVYENVFSWLTIKGMMPAAVGFDRRKLDYLAHTWIPNGWQWVDPLKESKAAENDILNNISSPYVVNASKGQDADEILEQNARFLKKMKDLEAEYGIEFLKTSETNASNPAQEEE